MTRTQQQLQQQQQQHRTSQANQQLYDIILSGLHRQCQRRQVRKLVSQRRTHPAAKLAIGHLRRPFQILGALRFLLLLLLLVSSCRIPPTTPTAPWRDAVAPAQGRAKVGAPMRAGDHRRRHGALLLLLLLLLLLRLLLL